MSIGGQTGEERVDGCAVFCFNFIVMFGELDGWDDLDDW